MMKINKIKGEKKAQEEIIGFVLIIIIVAVIFLVFLSLSVKKTPITYESKQAENFIESLMKHTTDCKISGNFQNIDDLTKACYNNRFCQNNKTACQELNETLIKLLEKSWNIQGTQYTSYSFLSFYETSGQNETIVTIQQGNCTGKKLGYSKPTYGYITSRFEICVK